MIEADASRFFKLSKRFNENKNVQCLKRIVNFEGEDKLDNILSSTSIPKHFDLLSIDIDEDKIQMIPKFLRHYPSSKLSIIHRFLLIFYQKGMKGYIEMSFLIMQKIIKKISNKN